MKRSERSNHCTRKRGSAEHTEVAEVIVAERRRTESIGVSSITEKGGMADEAMGTDRDAVQRTPY